MDAVTLGLAQADAKKKYRPKGLVSFPGLVPAGSRSSWNLFNTYTATGSDFQQLQFYVSDVVARSVRNPRFVFDGWLWDNSSKTELLFANSVTISMGLVTADGLVHPVFSNGQRTWVVNSGNRVTTDPVPTVLTKGDIIGYRIRVLAASGAIVYCNAYVNVYYGPNEGYEHGLTLTDKTLSGTISTITGPTVAVAPNLTLGEPLTNEPIIGIGASDSISAGYTDDTTFGSDGGYMRRALSGKLGFVRLGSASDQTSFYVTPANSGRRRALLAGCTSVIQQDGINDLKGGGRSLANQQADALTAATWQTNLGSKVFVCTLLPNTSSTDGWASTANQTVGSFEAARVGYNQWLRDGAPTVNGAAAAVGTTGALRAGQTGHPFAGIFDPCGRVETATDSGFWTPLGRFVTDAAITSGQNVLTSATGNFTTADLGKTIHIVGAGTSGGLMTRVVTNLTSSTQVVLSGTAGTTVTAAKATIGPATVDGLHPTGAASALAALAIDTTKLI